MIDNRNFFSDFDNLNSDYQTLSKFIDIQKNTLNANKSGESLKRNSTSRTGCTQQIICTQEQLIAKKKQSNSDHTFYNIENAEISTSNEVFNLEVEIGQNKKIKMNIQQSTKFEDIIIQIQESIGSLITNKQLKQLIDQLKSNKLIKKTKIEEESKKSKIFNENTKKLIDKQNYLQHQQAIILKDKRKMIFHFTGKSLIQDLDIFCITHKIAIQIKKSIKKAIEKGERLIMLSE